MCTPPAGQAWCMCRFDLEIAKWALGLLTNPGPVFYPLEENINMDVKVWCRCKPQPGLVDGKCIECHQAPIGAAIFRAATSPSKAWRGVPGVPTPRSTAPGLLGAFTDAQTRLCDIYALVDGHRKTHDDQYDTEALLNRIADICKGASRDR